MSTADLPENSSPLPPPPPPSRPVSTVLVRYGYLGIVGEFNCDPEGRPPAGTRVVIKTRRGTEMAEILAFTCEGCAKCVKPEQVEDYIDKSGGKDFPYTTEGRLLRIATKEDLDEHARIQRNKKQFIAEGRDFIREMELPMKLVDVEPVLGGEMATFYFLSEHRVDFRTLVKQLSARFRMRIQMHQVGARDEARLVADYETCGQPCCCKQFLKVLRPVSMGSAKMQKATLDPSKISGRCGRLKCCLRYEDALYDELRKRLPRVGSRVRTAEGVGVVEETMIITQLVKVRLDGDRVIAVANEELLDRDVKEFPKDAPPLPLPPRARPMPSREPAAAPSERPARPAPDNGDEQPRERGRNRNRRGGPKPAQSGPPPVQPPPIQESPSRPPVPQEPRDTARPTAPPPAPSSDTPAPPADGAAPGGMGSLGRRRRRRGRER